MSWREVRADDRITEWERGDGEATVRLRRSPDDTWTVRLDVLYQADESRDYLRERLETEAAARELAAAWREEYDAAGE